MTSLGARTPQSHPAFTGVLSVLVLAVAIGIYLTAASLNGWWPSVIVPAVSPTPSPADQGVEYISEQFGVMVSLPDSWEGNTSTIESMTAFDIATASPSETFSEIHIAHPLATAENPRQDIPIMVFTLAQWDRIGREEISVGAAPIAPSELARNSTYVFALPARYNFAYLTGWEEVQAILDDESVFAFDPEQ